MSPIERECRGTWLTAIALFEQGRSLRPNFHYGLLATIVTNTCYLEATED